MNDLQKHLANLFATARRWSAPDWSRVLIAEDPHDSGAIFGIVPRAAWSTPEEYAPRFDAHLDAGHSWINMNAAGIVDGAFLVVISWPQYLNTVPRELVSVNLSGPSMCDGRVQWDASRTIHVVD